MNHIKEHTVVYEYIYIELKLFFIFIILTIIIPLVVGFGDVIYNPRRSILGAIPVTKRIAYHLFNVNAYVSNTKEIVKLCRKKKWYSQYGTHAGN